jgi:hypothetical protein
VVATLQEAIVRQRESLAALLNDPLVQIAERCAEVWPDREGLDAVLKAGLPEVPFCKFLYALDRNAMQISDNVSSEGLMPKHFGRDRSGRPYMLGAHPELDFQLSDAYISLRARRPSLTALQVVKRDGEWLGYVGADFDLRDLPMTRATYQEPGHWRQIKGDPVIRGQVFHQCRIDSPLDTHIDEVLAVMEELIVDHGVFHCKIHFSSSRATIWLMEDPYRYRILDVQALTDPDVCLAYNRCDYPKDAELPASEIRPILEALKALRFMDETFYLRSASINIFNAMVSLTFSCDGSHYMRYDEFLAKDVNFWTGAATA